MAAVGCDGNNYNANGDDNLVYAGPFDAKKRLHYRTLTRGAQDVGNRVCEFTGEDDVYSTGLQVGRGGGGKG